MSFPIPPNEEQRLEELRRYALIDTPPEKAFDNITKLAARVFNVPIAAVTLIDEDRQWFKSCVGLETREVGRNFAFCAHAILSDDVMVIRDARQDSRFADSSLVTGPPYIRFYAAGPLRTRNGLNLGTICIVDTKPRRLGPEAIGMLAGLAALVVSEMELRYEIGERRRAAETLRLLRAAIEQSSESVIVTTGELDRPGPEIVFVNPAFTNITGYAAEEVVGKTPQILHGPKTERVILDKARAGLAEGKEVQFETINYRKNGSEFILSTHISPIRDEQGKVTHFICLQKDATERDRVAATLLRAKEEAERANRAKSEFLSRMSHELRTPLHAILGFAQLLESDGQSAEDKESVSQISRAGEHLLDLINEVLDISRVESGKLVFTSEPVAVRDILEETLSLARPLAAERGVRIELAGEVCEHEVFSSARRFKQVILNLISNAVKFSRLGGAVRVFCERVKDCVRINVSDAGRGISAENIGKLFVPFERLDADDAEIEGVGLGLSLSKHLIEAMDGRIGVESTPDEGTTFWVELPLVQRTSADNGPSRGAGDPVIAGRPTTPSGERTVLYIEDNPSNLRLVERIMVRRPEVRLLSATQGRAGLELAQRHQPDLVLLDLNLPDLSGDEILRELRADPRTRALRVVMISADATPGQAERLGAAGANDYLTKPIDVRKFLAVVDATESRNLPTAPQEGTLMRP